MLHTIPLSKIALFSFIASMAMLLPLHAQALNHLISGESKEKDHTGRPWFKLIQKSLHNIEVTSFIDGQGNTLSEEIITKKDATLEYFWTQNQTKKKSGLVLFKDKVIFNNKNEITISQEDQNKVVLPPMLFHFLEEKIKNEPKKTTFPITVIVPDKEVLIDFTFHKDGPAWILKADQFFIRLVVKPVKFLTDQKGNLIEIKDITPPVQFETKSRALETKMTDIIFSTDPK